MARPQRIEYEGAVYHVTARGNERRAIFRDDADREHFLRALAESVERFEVRLYLFCLMTNHRPAAMEARTRTRIQSSAAKAGHGHHRRLETSP